MGRSGHKQLDRLIDEVARGKRDLSTIGNAALRESVRIALRLHADAPSVPDAYTKARMRARVMARLDARPSRLRDTAWTFVELLARPAPFIVRGIALGSLVLCVVLAGFVASADTLPDDALYPMKMAAEQLRLTLAVAPADRASVEMSIAEHRLGEAEKLAATGRTSDALVASAFYSQHVATAAAELAPEDGTDLTAQLESRFSAQRERALTLATALATDVRSERASAVLAMIATSPLAPGKTQVERVAESAVTLAADLASAAEAASGASTRATAERPRTDAPAMASTGRPTLRPSPTHDPRASEAAKVARGAADKAKAAAEKTKQALEKANEKSRHR